MQIINHGQLIRNRHVIEVTDGNEKRFFYIAQMGEIAAQRPLLAFPLVVPVQKMTAKTGAEKVRSFAALASVSIQAEPVSEAYLIDGKKLEVQLQAPVVLTEVRGDTSSTIGTVTAVHSLSEADLEQLGAKVNAEIVNGDSPVIRKFIERHGAKGGGNYAGNNNYQNLEGATRVGMEALTFGPAPAKPNPKEPQKKKLGRPVGSGRKNVTKPIPVEKPLTPTRSDQLILDEPAIDIGSLTLQEAVTQRLIDVLSASILGNAALNQRADKADKTTPTVREALIAWESISEKMRTDINTRVAQAWSKEKIGELKKKVPLQVLGPNTDLDTLHALGYLPNMQHAMLTRAGFATFNDIIAEYGDEALGLFKKDPREKFGTFLPLMPPSPKI